MRADRDFYLDRLHPMQDRILARLAPVETGFYLTGGTERRRTLRILGSARGQALARSDDWQVVVGHQEARLVWLDDVGLCR